MRICVFGASSERIDKAYIERTEELGEKLASRGHSLMFGGGKNGLMGAVARGFTKGGGHITGVAPKFFVDADVIYHACDEFYRPDSMRNRKKYMEDNSDAFIVAPGGIGTYDELFETLTLKQLARHAKPIALFNINGYFNKLLRLISDNVKKGFIKEQTAELFMVSSDIDKIINYIESNTLDTNKIKPFG